MTDQPADDAVVYAAAELLKAAILLLDLMSAMPTSVMVRMPPDLLNRCTSHGYQSAFDALPDAVRDRARAIALADPDVQAARSIDQAARSR